MSNLLWPSQYSRRHGAPGHGINGSINRICHTFDATNPLQARALCHFAAPRNDRQLQAFFKRLTELEEAISILNIAGVVLSQANKRSFGDVKYVDSSSVTKTSARSAPRPHRRNKQEKTSPNPESALAGSWESQDYMQHQSAITIEADNESAKLRDHRGDSTTDTPTPGDEFDSDTASRSAAVRRRIGATTASGSSRALFGAKKGTRSSRSPREDKDGAVASLLSLIHENAFKAEIDLVSLESGESTSTTV